MYHRDLPGYMSNIIVIPVLWSLVLMPIIIIAMPKYAVFISGIISILQLLAVYHNILKYPL